MSNEQIAFAIEQLKALKVLDGGDAEKLGIGIVTEARWKATYDYMVACGPAQAGGGLERRASPTASSRASSYRCDASQPGRASIE